MTVVSEAVETRTARIFIRSDGIISITVLAGSEQTRPDIEESMSQVSRLSNGKKMPLLMDIRESKGIDREGRQYSASVGVGKHITAMAVLMNSTFSRIMGNFWLRTTKPLFPTRLFTSEEDAVAWLRDFEN